MFTELFNLCHCDALTLRLQPIAPQVISASDSPVATAIFFFYASVEKINKGDAGEKATFIPPAQCLLIIYPHLL